MTYVMVWLVMGLIVFGATLNAEAQDRPRVYRIGLLSPESPPSELLEEFGAELRRLGYVEGRNVAIEVRHAEGQSERLPGLADELVRRRVDVILAVNTSAVQAAKRATTTIPIVMTRVPDPVRTGLVSSLARPGGNVTGVTTLLEALSVKRLQLLKDIMPRLSRVAVLWYTGNLGGAVIAKELEIASAHVGLQLVRLPIQASGEFTRAVEAASRDRAEALLLVDDAVITKHRDAIVSFAAQHRMPVASQYRAVAEAGGLMAYGVRVAPMYRRTAHYVARILQGAQPADLPIEQPTEFELVINLKTAKAFGLTSRRRCCFRLPTFLNEVVETTERRNDMAQIRNESLSVAQRNDTTVTLRVGFTLRQNQVERDLFPNLRWNCTVVFFGVDSDGDHRLPKLFPTLLFNPSADRDIDHQLDFPFTRSELDEDPWWQVFNTEDEIRARISISPELQGVSNLVTDFTNTIRESF